LTKFSTQDSPDRINEDDGSQETAAMDELRQHLVGPERKRIDELGERLDNPDLLAKDVSRILPEAMVLRSTRDKKIIEVLEPAIEESIKASIKKDRYVLVDALFPVMGPAIRKAISSTILGMIQSFNRILEHSFSLQGLKWRIEALRTKRPFAEVIMLHTLIYQVEQIFLIHKNTGLVLQHVVAKEVPVQDPDMVSSMLTAILDFVSDSFGLEQGGGLDTLRIGGDRSVWIEQGAYAVMAAVIRGTPPVEVRTVFCEALDLVHMQQNEALQSFDGDVTPFETQKNLLESCLQFQAREKQRKISPLLWLVLAAIIFIISFGTVNYIRGKQQRAKLITRLQDEPGIVITAYKKRSGKYHIFGLRDPLSIDPEKMSGEENFSPDEVVFHWEPYHSIHSQFVVKRMQDILTPPETVMFEFENGVLSANGSALRTWIVETKNRAKNLPGISQYDDHKITDINQVLDSPETITLELKNGVLHAHGKAAHQWIIEARNRTRDLPGITAYRDDNIVDTDIKTVEETLKKIESQLIFFTVSETELPTGQEHQLEKLVLNIERLFRSAHLSDQRAHIEIVGHADSIGKEETNMEISRKRAENILSFFVSKGLEAKNFSGIAVGSTEPLKEEVSEQDRAFNRCVTFSVKITDIQK